MKHYVGLDVSVKETSVCIVDETLKRRLADVVLDAPGDGLAINWLGQAGFVIDSAGCRLVTDLYLSNSLVEKYRGTVRPHLRMAPPPVEPSEIPPRRLCPVLACAHRPHGPGEAAGAPARQPANKAHRTAGGADQALPRSGVKEKRIIFPLTPGNDFGGTGAGGRADPRRPRNARYRHGGPLSVSRLCDPQRGGNALAFRRLRALRRTGRGGRAALLTLRCCRSAAAAPNCGAAAYRETSPSRKP